MLVPEIWNVGRKETHGITFTSSYLYQAFRVGGWHGQEQVLVRTKRADGENHPEALGDRNMKSSAQVASLSMAEARIGRSRLGDVFWDAERMGRMGRPVKPHASQATNLRRAPSTCGLFNMIW